MRRLLALLGVAALLAGCGAAGDSAEDFQGAEREVARTIQALEEAAQDGDERVVCRRLLARAVVERLAETGGGCERAIDRALAQVDVFGLDIQRIDVRGDVATARVQVGRDDEDVEQLRLVREDGGFKIADLSG